MGKKQVNCDPADPDDDHQGDWWDHVAFDPEHKLVLAVVPGARVTESVVEVVSEVKDRLDERPPALMTSDEYAPYETVIEEVFSPPVVAPQGPARPGRRPVRPERCLGPEVTSATIRKERKNNRVVAVPRTVVLGGQQAVDAALKASVCSRTINTSFVERQHGTARGQNARQSWRTYRFSKDWAVPESMSYFTRYRYNFCWPVRTLRVRDAEGRWQERTPAMSAGLADHVWSLEEWLNFPAVQRRFPRLGKKSIISTSEASVLRGFGCPGPPIVDYFPGPDRPDRPPINTLRSMTVRMLLARFPRCFKSPT
ncbi:MAG: hypothetical protein JO034_26555 [Singulisphaera sp.]|nr:hypothetical protein [Singulisphaera sp.]